MKKDKLLRGYNITNPKLQAEKVLVHLLENKTITSWNAIEKHRITRLSAVIFNLRYNFKIKSEDTSVNGKRFTTYIYEGTV
tara:strand:+ start:333 stop:575 length:243 start_codon:yes stop_codon:yes gene_type:complete